MMKKLFDIRQVRYPWLLVFSMVAFVGALYINRSCPAEFDRVGVLVYGGVFLIALLWGILNYAAHLQRSAVCRKFESVEGFVSALPVERQEKEELVQYPHDYVKDLEEGGKSHQQAVETAIGQFQVREITRMEGGLMETKPHYYLLGYAVIFFGIVLAIGCVNLAVALPFWVLAVEFMLACYGVGFAGLFVIYRLADIVISRK